MFLYIETEIYTFHSYCKVGKQQEEYLTWGFSGRMLNFR